MFYNYIALNTLTSYESEYFETVRICCYFVFLNGKKPILTYLLKKQNEEYDFITLKNNYDLHENVNNSFCSNIHQSIYFKGFKKYKNHLYAFYELIEQKKQEEIISNNLEKCLIYEILNTKKIRDKNVSNNVVDFFYNNSFFSYLYDSNNQLIEIPISAYDVVNDTKKNYVCYNEILLEPNDDYYKLKLYFSNEENYITLRYAVFLQEFISVLDTKQKQLYTDLKSFDSIIISKSKEIYFKNKSQQLLL